MKFYTAGYGNRQPEDFLDVLQGAGVRTVIDIRHEPVGRISPYTKRASADKGIQGLLSTRGIAYRWIKELGNPYRRDDDWRSKYAALFVTVCESAYPQLLSAEEPAALMCGCLRVETCHREYVADLLIQRGHEVLHL